MGPSEMPTHGHLQELMALESHYQHGEEIRYLAKLPERGAPTAATGRSSTARTM
ncbi:MAG: hypothetical protein R3F11_18815 [Verrucomicrobiales bacterium]